MADDPYRKYKEAGLKFHSVWVHPDDWPDIQRRIKILRLKRMKEQTKWTFRPALIISKRKPSAK